MSMYEMLPHFTVAGGSDGKESTCKVGDLGSIPGLGRFPGERKGYPLQYSGLKNPMDCIVRGVAKSQTQLSDFTLFGLFNCSGPGIIYHRQVSGQFSFLVFDNFLISYSMPGTFHF